VAYIGVAHGFAEEQRAEVAQQGDRAIGGDHGGHTPGIVRNQVVRHVGHITKQQVALDRRVGVERAAGHTERGGIDRGGNDNGADPGMRGVDRLVQWSRRDQFVGVQGLGVGTSWVHDEEVMIDPQGEAAEEAREEVALVGAADERAQFASWRFLAGCNLLLVGGGWRLRVRAMDRAK
jgi:hypothetical protein